MNANSALFATAPVDHRRRVNGDRRAARSADRRILRAQRSSARHQDQAANESSHIAPTWMKKIR